MNLKPLNKNVAATRYVAPQTGVLMLAPKPEWIFDVVAVADDVTGIAVGDRILVEQYRSVEVDIDGELVHLIPKERVMAILRQQDGLG